MKVTLVKVISDNIYFLLHAGLSFMIYYNLNLYKDEKVYLKISYEDFYHRHWHNLPPCQMHQKINSRE